MKKRLRSLPFVFGAIVTLAGAGNACAQAWEPRDPVALLVGAAAGGDRDHVARTMDRIMTENGLIATPMTVVDQPGDGGARAFVDLRGRSGDPDLLAIGSNALLVGSITGKSGLAWTELTPLAVMIHEYIAFMVRSDSPYTSGRGLLAKLKTDPRAVTVGVSSAVASTDHFAVAQVVRQAGIDSRNLRIVVFPSSSASLAALLDGHVDLVAGPPDAALKDIATGKLRALGITAPHRLAAHLANVPTWREQGIDAVVANWRGVVGTPELTREHADYWKHALRALAATRDWKRELARNGWVNAALYGADAARYLKTQSARLKRTLAALGAVE